MRSLAFVALLLPLACRSTAAQTSTPDAHARLRELGSHYWDALLAEAPLQALNQNGVGYLGGPLYATSVGDHRFDERLDDLSPAAHARLLARLAELRTLAAALPPGDLDEEERISLETLLAQLDDARDAEQCRVDLWLVDPQNGPQVQLAQTALSFDPAQAGTLAKRYAQGGRFFDQIIANLRAGLAARLVSPRANVVRVIAQLDELLGSDAAHSPLRGPGGPLVEQELLRSVLPGAQRLRDFLRDELLPQARPDHELGLWALGLGEGCYSFLARRHTGTDLTPREVHELGRDELSRIEAEASALALELGAHTQPDGRVDLRDFRAGLARRPDQFKQSGDELLRWNQELLARASAALPKAFLAYPLLPLEVRAVEAYRAPSFPVGYYQPPPDGGAQPGIYYVNTWRPETRALYNNEALLFHEAVPGHHLQGSVMLQAKGLPEYRRQFGPTAYIEGWALYSERMADETLHLYSSPIARFGMLGYQAWRAARLIVDSGMHFGKWERERAVRFLVDHTTLLRGEAENEIDRYAAAPGQALGYLVGELEIFRLREEARARLGPRFDLRGFHDVVLRHGPVSPRTLERLVRAWSPGSAPAG